MIEICFEGHALTLDNIAGVASGHCDVALDEIGIEYTRTRRRERYANEIFDVVYTSDMQRAFDTARLIFADRDISIIRDARLRECDYGDYEGRPRSEMEAFRPSSLSSPFPNGESYEQVSFRVRDFLDHVVDNRDEQRMLLVGHMATIWMLEYWLSGRALAEVIGQVPEQRVFTLEPAQWPILRDK
jgi:broad specificity phosphatase PhoE